jgi:hypothetical protein
VNRQQCYGNARVPRFCCAAREVAPDASLEGIDAGGAPSSAHRTLQWHSFKRTLEVDLAAPAGPQFAIRYEARPRCFVPKWSRN